MYHAALKQPKTRVPCNRWCARLLLGVKNSAINIFPGGHLMMNRFGNIGSISRLGSMGFLLLWGASCSGPQSSTQSIRSDRGTTEESVVDTQATASNESEDATGDLSLIGGKVADPADFPASIYISAGNSRCSATVVGPRVVITAAHCVSNGGSIKFSVGPNRYSGTCRHHPSYRRNATADWALCQTNLEVIGIQYEVVNSNPDLLVDNSPILLTGYGCTSPGGRGGNDGRYRTGESTMIRIPAENGSNHDIVTRGQGSALCFGDSGGPAFVWLDSARTQRVLVSINSRGDIRTTSYLSSVSQPTALSWFKEWMEANQEKICGISPDAEKCRNGIGQPGGGDPLLTAECKKMQDDGALAALEKCANEPITEPQICLDARDTISACIESKLP